MIGRGLSSAAALLAALVAYGLACARIVEATGDSGGGEQTPYHTPGTSNAYRAPLMRMEPPGLGHSMSLEPVPSAERAALNGTPTISDTYNPRDQGTDWPPDAFTTMVAGHESPRPISSPALHSYDGDGNMEALSAFGPFSRQEDRYDLGAYTGAVGPAGGSTPENHPEVTAP